MPQDLDRGKRCRGNTCWDVCEWRPGYQQHSRCFRWRMQRSSYFVSTGPFLRSSYNLQDRQIRRMSMTEKVQKRKKKMSKRDIVKKMKQLRWVAKIKKANMDHEQKLRARIEKAEKKIVKLQKQLKNCQLAPLPMPDHDPEPLTTEQLQSLKKIGRKNRNYCPVGIRGIFGGVIQNMHLHWKKHETVQVRCDNFPEDKIKEMAEELARLSGGIVVDIINGHTIIVYRGKNYTRPMDIIPKNTLSKRKALFKAKCELAITSHKQTIEETEQELESHLEYKAQQALNIPPPQEDSIQLYSDSERFTDLNSDSDLGSELDDPTLICDSDSVLESDSDSSSDIDSTNAHHLPQKP